MCLKNKKVTADTASQLFGLQLPFITTKDYLMQRAAGELSDAKHFYGYVSNNICYFVVAVLAKMQSVTHNQIKIKFVKV